MNIDSDEHGIASEAMVENALQQVQNKPNDDSIPKIKEFVHAKKNSALDRQHIDFLVKLENGLDVPLQVKSSERRRRRFERFNAKHRRFIPVIVVKIGEALESVINKVVACIKLALNTIRRVVNQKIHQKKVREQKRRKRCFRFFSPSMCH
ncbi:MAG: hypothetical protein AAB470_00045 [Patescibacteria group bacterium]